MAKKGVKIKGSEHGQLKLFEIEKNYHSFNTKMAYSSRHRLFLEFLDGKPENEENLLTYLVELSRQKKKFSTITLTFQALSRNIKIKDKSKFSKVLTSIRNTLALDGITTGGALALSKKTLHRFIRKMEKSEQNQIIKARNKAILLLLYHGAFRVSELINLKIENLEYFQKKGVRVHVLNSKTDHNKIGFYKAIFYKNDGFCPVKALQLWLNQLNSRSGYVFRSVSKVGAISRRKLNRQDVWAIIKKLDKKYSPHSLRVGFITDSALNGANFSEIMNQTTHKTVQMVVHYTRPIHVFQNNAAEKA